MTRAKDEKTGRRTIVRGGAMPPSASLPVAPPLYPSVVYASPSADALDAQYEGRLAGYTYAREGHPNADMLAEKIDWLEGGEGGLITSSGMAAISAMFLGLLSRGDHVLAGDQLYGRSLRMLTQDLPRLGIEISFADAGDADAMAAALRPNTRIILVEAVSNPTLRVADMQGIADLATRSEALLAVDNTFTTPAMFRPLESGADIVINSITKFLAGHSDVTLGYVTARDADHRQAMRDAAVTWGLTPSPFDCWLADRGLHSFDLRFAAAERSAATIADHLSGYIPGGRGISRVLYPGRADHPDHHRAQTLFGGRYGNMVTFEIDGARPQVNAFIAAAAGIPFAPTLGDIGSTLSHPASSSHRGLSADGRAALGIGEGMFRLSVGIEPVEMLIADLDAALAAVRGD
ncbi:MAG: cystathionine gamma-synthase [SAR116 cluster bacterium]|nr:cystathionine gamma-synthase [SAR116 cluster bacterium]RPG99586.1 MAG: aminotransferase class I/II-fold pyridoxal phosphate-dependent enzyme [Candidatus Puniceispirillum sp. TMED176]